MKLLEEIFESDKIDIQPLNGGDINDVYKITQGNVSYAVKVNFAEHFPGMFQKESDGLNLLNANGTIRIPKVFRHGNIDTNQFLILEYITSGEQKKEFWGDFGRKLAQLHSNQKEKFGFDHDNFIGSLIQRNGLCENWQEFLITQRLEPMVEMAVNSGEVNFVEGKLFDNFYKRIKEVYPDERASLLHGDLWDGNYLVDQNGDAVLIDPAVYYGHREMEIGMMNLFGGFDDELYNAYNEINPLEKNWKERIKLNQLYPLMVHVNLFGRSYWNQVLSILEGFK